MKNKFLSSKNIYYMAAGMLLLFCLFLRIWRADMVPAGLHLDEAGMAYDAWCLSQYGVDRYLTSWPVYLFNYGGGQSALYAYLTAALFRIFGFSTRILRLPAALFSCLTVLFGMKICRKIYPNSYFHSLICGIVLTICPALILIGRLGLDCYLMLGASAVFLYFFLCAVDTNKLSYYLLAGISGGILLYTYILTYIILPVFLLFALCYVLYQKKFSAKGWIAMAIPLALLSIPLILTLCVNLFGWSEISIGPFTCILLNAGRTNEFHTFRFSYFLDLLRNTFLSSDFSYCSVPGFYNLYLISIPLFVIGFINYCRLFVQSFRSKKWGLQPILFVWLLLIILLFCHIPSNGYRVCGIYLVVGIMITDGIFCIIGWIAYFMKKIGFEAGKTPKRATALIITFIYAVSFLQFGKYYYLGSYTVDTYPLIHFGSLATEAFSFIDEHPEYGPKGVQLAQTPVYYALSTLESPYELMLTKQEHFLYQDGYIHCSYLGAIEDGYFYIVENYFTEYSQELRDAGFSENRYPGYSLFYMK